MPRGLLGAYYVFVLTDAPGFSLPRGAVFEGSAEGNNARAGTVPMLIELPPPADLQVQTIDVPPTGTAGQDVTVTWTAKNTSGETITAIWDDALYLSSDAVWDLGDKLIGRVQQYVESDGRRAPKTLAPGAEYTATLTAALPTTLPGAQRVLVRADIFDDIREDEFNANNTLASADTIAVQTQRLQIGVPAEDTLSTGQERLYAVPAKAGETLEIQLTSQSQDAAHEVYVRFEGLPNSIHYDAAYEGHLWADQRVLVPETHAGTYYVLVRGTHDPADNPITLNARYLPFGITELGRETGGDGRYFTLDIRGARFDRNALVKLIRPQIAEYEPVDYEVLDATRIRAIFDLQDAPHGLYDVLVTNPDGQTSRLPYRFLVESALPYDVTVGMGGPSQLNLGDVGVYGFGIYSLTNVDTPYVHFEFGLPHLENQWADLIPGDLLVFRTNLTGQPDVPDVPWADLDPIVNLDGDLMAPGFTFDLINRGFAGLTFTADVFPQLRTLLEENPKFLEELDDFSLGELAFDFYIRAAATPMTVAEYLEYQRQTAADLRTRILAAPTTLLTLALDWQDELDAAGNVPDDLRASFESRFVTLSETARISVDEAGQRWRITDAGDELSIERRDTGLEVFRPTPRALTVLAGDEESWTELYLASLTDAGLLRPEDEPPGIRLQPEIVSLMSAITAGLLIDSPDLTESPRDEILAAGKLAGFFDQVRRWYGHDPNEYGSLSPPDPAAFDLGLSHTTHFASFQVHVGKPGEAALQTAADPNLQDYFGAGGRLSTAIQVAGPQGFVSGSQNIVPVETPLPYAIRFENPSDAENPISRVRILQQLDPHLDVRTFRLGDIRLGDIAVNIPDDRAAFVGDFDLVDQRGIVLRVTAGVDVVSRTAEWLLTAIDPLTGLEVRDPSLGLLFPNRDGTERGTVAYTIEAAPGVATGDEIAASARVIYGSDAPLDTAAVVHTLDAVPPVTTFTVQAAGGNSYSITWSGSDDPTGSGVKDFTLYQSVDGGGYAPVVQRTALTSYVVQAAAGEARTFLVRASDNAGNVEPEPAGVSLPSYNPAINLGSLPSEPALATRTLRRADVPQQPVTNPLFLQALNRVPAAPAATRRPEFTTVYEPFVATAFARYVPESGADIGALSAVPTPDGLAVLVTGGTGRNSLWRFGLSGGTAGTPLATLDVPLYDLAFDAQGQLWATTGGGPLVQLDPETGQIVARFGDGVEHGLAALPDSTRLYVSTRNGVELFDTQTHQFLPFSGTRVHGLAVAPDAAHTVWGTTWPDGGQVVRFDRVGGVEVWFPDIGTAQGLAFGAPASPLENLLFISRSDGRLTMVDTVANQAVDVALGGARAEYVHVSPRGQLYVAQGGQVDLLAPATPPQVLQITPARMGFETPGLGTATVRFDADMRHNSPDDPASVINPQNYTLADAASGERIAITAVSYDAATRTATLIFEPLSANEYLLIVMEPMQNEMGVALGACWQSEFTVLGDVTGQVAVRYSRVRSDLRSGGVSVDLVVANTGGTPIQGPLRVVYGSLTGSGVALLQATGDSPSGSPYVDLLPGDQQLAVGQATPRRTLTFLNSNGTPFDLSSLITTVLAPNSRPVIGSTPSAAASVGQGYAYTVQATDVESTVLTYSLVTAPPGATLDSTSGQLAWTPDADSLAAARFRVRAYDPLGAFGEQAWTVAVAGVNTPPVVFPVPDQALREGQTLELPVVAFDADGDPLFYWVDHLPAGARFDAAEQTLRWTPTADAAGRYADVTLFASDGRATVSQAFTIVVSDVNQPPQFAQPVDRTIQEGETLTILLAATDADGDDIEYHSRNLPPGATLDRTSGAFLWTLRYDQHGRHRIELSAGDGVATTTRTLTVDVLNRNGAVRLEPLDRFSVREGQPVAVRLNVSDADFPGWYVYALEDDAGLDIEAGGLQLPVTVTHTALPPGATFATDTLLLEWATGFQHAGSYAIDFTATDDGDGTGTPTSDTVTLRIDVLNANGAPTVAPIANRSVDVGAALDFTVTASDPEGDPLVLSATGLPAFATFTDLGNGTAAIHAAPQPGDRGNYPITVSARDNGGGTPAAALTGQASFVLTANSPNEPPRIGFVGNKVALVGQPLTFTASIADADQDPLTFSASGLPAGATFAATGVYGVGQFQWTPTAGQIGTHPVTLRVADSGAGDPGRILTDAETIDIVVRAANAAPALQPIGGQQVAEGAALVVQLAAADGDGDPLTFAATGLPLGAVLDAQTGRFQWTPNFVQAGQYPVRFSVSDGSAVDREDVTIVVAPSNQAPHIAALPPLLGMEGQPLAFTVAGGDLDGEPTQFFVAGTLPAGATFQASTGEFRWTPGYDQAGAHTIRFGVSDPLGLTDTFDAQIQVLNVNRAPVFDSLPGRALLVGEPFQTTVPAHDPDGQTLTFSAVGLPAGAQLNEATGVLSWTPRGVQIGEHHVLLLATDGELAERAELRLVVAHELAPPDVHLELTPSFPLGAGQRVSVRAIASGVGEIASLEMTIAGQAVALDSLGRAYFTPPAPGHYPILARATDSNGAMGTATADLKVRDVSDLAAPVVSIGAPPDGAVLTTPQQIVATVQDANLDAFALEIAPLGSEAWQTLAAGTAPVANAPLALLDPNRLANGAYTLRLTATDMGGRRTVEARSLEVNSSVKLAAFETAVTDLSVVLGGFPLELVRRYSSLAVGSTASFGYGWRLDLVDPQIATNIPPTGAGQVGDFVPLRDGARVYLNLPDGRRAGFSFTPQLQNVGGQTWYTPAWTADVGVDYQLASADATLVRIEGRYFERHTGLPYHPASGRFTGHDWTLTAADGTRYGYDTTDGLREIVTAAGRRLVCSSSGVVADNGERIDWRHDAAGRMTEVIAPDGGRTVYAYDSLGNLVSASDLGAGTRGFFGYNDPATHRLTAIASSGAAAGVAVSYDAQGGLDAVHTLDAALGVTRQFLGQSTARVLAAGEVDRYAIALSDAELRSAGTGRITLGVEVRGSGGFNPAAPHIVGVPGTDEMVESGRSLALFTFPRGGVFAIDVAGANAAAAGAYQIEVYLAGDVNGDGALDGLDSPLLDAAFGTRVGDAGYRRAADANRDGVVDGADRLLLETGFGFVADQRPTAGATSVDTYRIVPVAIDLATLAADPERSPLSFGTSDSQHGTVRLAEDGHTAYFTPSAGFSGAASFAFWADDGRLTSSLATVTIDVSAAALENIRLAEQDLALGVGQAAFLHVIGEFSDGEQLTLPAGLAHFASLNPAAAAVSPTGGVAGLAEGISTIVVTAEGLTAATPVTVGGGVRANYDFYPAAYALSPGGATRQFVVREQLADLSVVERSAAAAGARYYVSNPAIATITADGLLTSVAAGQTYVTTVFGGRSSVAALTVVAPQTGTTVVGADGGIVASAADPRIAIGIGPGALPAGTTVVVRPATEAELPFDGDLPAGFGFGAAFHLDLGGAELAEGLSATLPAPAGAQPGDTLFLFRPSRYLVSPGVYEGAWEIVDRLVVEANGLARTTSPPFAGISTDGLMLMSSPTLVTAMFVSLAFSTQGARALIQTSELRQKPFIIAPGLFADFLMPLPTGVGVELRVPNEQGWVATKTLDTSQAQSVVAIFPPAETPPGAPRIAGLTLEFATEPTLVISGASFADAAHTLVELVVGGQDATDDAGNLVPVGGRDAWLTGEAVWVNDERTEIRVAAPTTLAIGTAQVRVYAQQDDPIVASNAVALTTDPRYAFAALGSENRVAVIDTRTALPNPGGDPPVLPNPALLQLIARIPVAEEHDFPAPRAVSATIDQTRAYVTLQHAASVSVVDAIALREVDLEPDLGGVQRIQLPIGAEPFWVFAARPLPNPSASLELVETGGGGGAGSSSGEDSAEPIAPCGCDRGRPPGSNSGDGGTGGGGGAGDVGPGEGLPFIVPKLHNLQFAYVSDALGDGYRAQVYVLDINPESDTYNQHVQTIVVSPAPLGLRGLTVSADGRRLYVAAPGKSLFSRTAPVAGNVLVIDLDPSSPTFHEQIGAIPVGPEPYGITATTNSDVILVTDRTADAQGMGMIRRTPGGETGAESWSVTYTNLLELGRDPAKRYYQTFGVSNAEGVAYLPENALAAVIGPHPAYAFVTGFNRLIAGDPKHDPNFDPIAGAGCIDYAGGCAAASGPAQSATGEVSPLYIRHSSGNILVTRQDGLRTPGVAQIAGGNVAIIRDPLGDPTFEGVGLVAGTRNTPNSFPDNLVLSGQFLLASYRGNDAVMAFSAAEIVKTIESIVARQGTVDFNLADLHTRAIDDLQPQVDTRAEFQFFQFVADETGQPLGYLDPQAPATQLIGLDGSSQSINALDPSFSLALYFTSIPSSPRSPIGVGGTPQGLAAQPEVDGVAIDPRTNPYNLKNGMCEAGVCAEFAAFAHTTSEVELHSGAVHERHAVPTYTAFGATRGLVLHYDSLRADPRPIVHFGFDNVSEAQGGNSRMLTARITAQGVDTDVHAFSVPAAGGRTEAALQLDMSRHPSGVYPYQLQTSLSSGSAAAQHDQVVVVNGIASPFGAGWNLEELHEIVVNDDGSALLISGDGSEMTFQPPRDGSRLYVSPAGDYSELRQTAAGTFERTMKDGTVYRFNAYHRLASVTDRLSNTVQYLYDDYCRLIEVIDPAGLRTTLAYSGDRVASMNDPFSRTTRFAYDTDGNLIRITDPDGTQRSFRYDDLHHLTGETTKRGFEETIEYDFAGRAVRATRADGGVIEVSAAQTNGLYSPDQTKPGSDSPPPARDLGSPEGRVVQPNGAVVSTRVGQTGTATAGRDAIGPTSTAQRDAAGRVTQVTDALQRSLVFSYDTAGNRTAVTDDVGRSETAYDPQFSQVTRETDSLGRQIRYGLDPETGSILTRTQVVGEFGGTDDVVSQYTYLAHGLLDRVTDPLGHVTDYDYDARGHVTAITFAAGTAVAAERRYEYDGPGNVTAVIDENGQRTEHEYDVMNRRTLTRDPLGNVTRFEYDAAGNLSEETDARGHATAYEYDGVNRRIQVVDALGNVGAFRFDHQGNLLEATGPLQQRETTEYDARNRPIVTRDALGHATTYTYDADDNLLALTDPNGNTTQYEYDARNRLVKVTNALGGTTKFTYDAANQRLSETDEAGRTTRYAYDDLGRLITTTDPLGGVIRNAYDAAGNLSSVTDALGRTTTYTYDARNRRTQIEDALGNRTTFQYDAVGNQTAIQDAMSRSVQFTYDALNRVLRETDALGNVTLYSYDAVGNQTSVTDALGRVTTYAYDVLDRRTSRTDAVGGVAVWAYDDAGRMVAERDELGRTVAHAYDEVGREISRTEPGDRTTTFEYDALGNLLRITDPLGQSTRYAYDALTRRIGVTDATGATTRYAFDAVGNVLSVTDPLGNETTYAYDALDRTVGEANELGSVRRYSYDAVGNLVSQTDRNGRESQFTYDALDRRVEERWLGAAPRTITTTYDAVGQVTVAADVDSRYVYTYDAIGRLTGVSNSGTPGVPTVAMAYTFDAVDNLLTRTDTIDGTAAGTTSYVYDSLNRVQRITQSGPTVSDKRVDLAYNAASQATSLDRYSDLAGTQRVLSSFFSYDAAGRLATLEHTQAAVGGGGGALAHYAYTYDAVNRITQIVSADGTAGYTYDASGQLIAVDNTTLPDETYTYDANGNRRNAGYATGVGNRLASEGTYQYTYDAEGNRLRRTHIASGEVIEYAWDHRNRLTRVVVKSSGGIILKDSAYTYDVLNRRIAASVDADGAGAGAAVNERMVYDDQNLALVFDGAGARTQRYLYGPQIDQVLADERAAGPVYWTLGDQQGSVRDIADSTGALRNHLVYDAFGKILSESNPDISHRFAFTGREFDSATGLYYYRARYYDAPLGLFLSEDPRGFNAGPANFYTYVGNSPLNATDPLGEEAWIAAQTPYSPEEAARSAQLARRLGNLAFVTAGAAAAGALAAPVFAAGFGLAGGAAVGLLGESIGGGLAGLLALGTGIVGARQAWDHFYSTLTDPNLDQLQKLERLLPGLAATISGGIVGRRLCGLSESAFEAGYGIGSTPKDWAVGKAKKWLRDKLGAVSSATPEQIAAIQRLAAREGYEIAIRDSDKLTAWVTKKLSNWGFEAKPEHIKAKSFFGIIYDRQSGKWYRSDLDIAWVRKGGQIVDNQTQLDKIIPTLNRMLRRPGTGPEQTDSFLHGSHATALRQFGGGPTIDAKKYHTFAEAGGGPVTVYSGGGQYQLTGKANKRIVFQYFQEPQHHARTISAPGGYSWLPGDHSSLLATDVRVPDLASVVATPLDVFLLAAAARDLWNQSVAGVPIPEVVVTVADLPGARLAQARLVGAGGIASAPFAEVVVDADAAGYGWFVDPTPLEHGEFATLLGSASYIALPDLDAAGKYDLLAVSSFNLPVFVANSAIARSRRSFAAFISRS